MDSMVGVRAVVEDSIKREIGLERHLRGSVGVSSSPAYIFGKAAAE